MWLEVAAYRGELRLRLEVAAYRGEIRLRLLTPAE
jgi:hypothetical protein